MLTAGFLRQKFPKRHDFTIEECVAAGSVLTVVDATALLSAVKRRRLSQWAWPARPSLRLVAGKMGACRRWWLRCPSCQRRCEALYKQPRDPGADWSCRICAGVTYGSRRYGRRHAARKIPTPRQKIIARRRDEAERRLLDAWAKSDPRWAALRDAVREQMARAVDQRDAEAAQAAAWLLEQLRRPRPIASPREIAQGFGPDVLRILQGLNTEAISRS